MRTGGFLLSAGLPLSVLFLAGCSTAPKTTPELFGVANFRDTGGYRTSEGHVMRRGVLYRSAQLSTPTAADQQKLAALGIKYEIDLRSEQERTDQPSRWGKPAPLVLTPFHYPEDGKAETNSPNSVAAMTSKFMSPTSSADELNELMKKNYASMIVDRAQEMGDVLHNLAIEDAPALIHCTGGKDRTGQTVAVLMTVLGVPRDQVFEEYLKSNGKLKLWYEQATAKMPAGSAAPISYEVFKARAGASRVWLEEAFAAIDSHYGSFDAYVRDGLRLSPEDAARLKARFLQE